MSFFRFAFYLVLLFPFSCLSSFEAIYLTLPSDPAHEMAIHWLETPKEQVSILSYEIDGRWQEVEASSEPFSSMLLKKVLLSGLQPDTSYRFRIGEDLFFFRTLPKERSRPVKIALGGDAYQKTRLYEKMNRTVASYSPDFVILGGDIAYASPGALWRRWVAFFKKWGEQMVAEDGRMIPLVGVIGNHDVSFSNPVFFEQLFPYLQKGTYGSLHLLGDVSFFLLDTEHVAPVEGVQAKWLEEELKQSSSSYKFPVYHVAAYPSVDSMNGKVPSLVRGAWVPLFELYGVRAVFEHHNHAFKKTYPILEGKIDPKGITYIGDGSWGVSTRRTRDVWYLQDRGAVNAFSLMTISSVGVGVEMINNEGIVLSTWKSPS
jgi:acid phosphatase type 7